MMLIGRQFIAPDSSHVKAIADGFDIMRVVASAWVEMMLQRPGGAEKVHERLQVCVDAAAERGDVQAGETLRGTVRDFGRLCETGLESDSAENEGTEQAAEVPPVADMEPRPLAGSETASQPVTVMGPAHGAMTQDIRSAIELPGAGPDIPSGGPALAGDSGVGLNIFQAIETAKQALRQARM